MQDKFAIEVSEICHADSRYSTESYYFIREGLDHTLKSLKRAGHGHTGHVSGQELLHGIRDYALQEFGPMTKMVLNEWGIHSCEDIGHIVFNLVTKGVLGKTDHDSPADFQNAFTFDEAFVNPFKPRENPPSTDSEKKISPPRKRKRSTGKESPEKAAEDLF